MKDNAQDTQPTTESKRKRGKAALESLLALATEGEQRYAPDPKLAIRLEDDDKDRRPAVWAKEGAMHAVLAHVALHLHGALFILPPSVLARIVHIEDGDTFELATGVVAEAGSAIVEPITTPALVAMIGAAVRLGVFVKDKSTQELRWADRDCPTRYAAALGAAPGLFGQWRPIAGIARVPVIKRDGSLVFAGYDPETRMFVEAPRPTPPQRPTRDDANRAVPLLLSPFDGYGLDDRERRACILAAVLTAIARPSLATAPGVLVDGNVPGAGKGKLARALAAICAGGGPVLVTEGHAPEETEKRIEASLLSGPPAILIDNVQRQLASSALESMLTEGKADIRILGQSRLAKVRPRGLLLITANNASVRGDLDRRIIPIRIVAATDRPEARQFDFDPVTRALERRTAILEAGFTVLRWWQRELAAGAKSPALGSFEAWARLVAGAVLALTGVNVCEVISNRRLEDPAARCEAAVFEKLANIFGTRHFKTSAALEALPTELFAELGLRTNNDGKPDPRAFTAWFRRRRDRVHGMWQLRSITDGSETTLWTITPVATTPDPTTGFLDFLDSSTRPKMGSGLNLKIDSREESEKSRNPAAPTAEEAPLPATPKSLHLNGSEPAVGGRRLGAIADDVEAGYPQSALKKVRAWFPDRLAEAEAAIRKLVGCADRRWIEATLEAALLGPRP